MMTSTSPTNPNTIVMRVDTPIIHGAGTDGSNTTLIRRMTRQMPDGSFARIPHISGNSWRGLLRRSGAWEVWDLLGRPTLSASAARVLSSGGELSATKPAPLELLAGLRTLVDQFTVFGAAWAGTIHEGSLVVGHLLPECVELGTGSAPAARLIDSVMGTRHDTTPIPAEAITHEEGVAGTQMIYESEALCSGARLRTGLRMRPWATGANRDWVALCVRRWVDDGAHIGGKSSIGHGAVAIIDAPDWLSVVAAERARDRVRANSGDIAELIAAL